MDKTSLTKIFLRAAGLSVNDVTLAEYFPIWWKNISSNGGLRLTDEGFMFVTEVVELQTYDVPFPPDFKLTAQIIIFLDKLIDCPYWLGRDHITVTDEKKAVELHLFSGDMRKYGLTKAMKRQDNN
jgi:hypothetical protein